MQTNLADHSLVRSQRSEDCAPTGPLAGGPVGTSSTQPAAGSGGVDDSLTQAATVAVDIPCGMSGPRGIRLSADPPVEGFDAPLVGESTAVLKKKPTKVACRFCGRPAVSGRNAPHRHHLKAKLRVCQEHFDAIGRIPNRGPLRAIMLRRLAA